MKPVAFVPAHKQTDPGLMGVTLNNYVEALITTFNLQEK